MVSEFLPFGYHRRVTTLHSDCGSSDSESSDHTRFSTRKLLFNGFLLLTVLYFARFCFSNNHGGSGSQPVEY
jgi:hypothetical protein